MNDGTELALKKLEEVQRMPPSKLKNELVRHWEGELFMTRAMSRMDRDELRKMERETEIKEVSKLIISQIGE